MALAGSTSSARSFSLFLALGMTSAFVGLAVPVQTQTLSRPTATFTKDIGTGASGIVTGTKDTVVLLGRCGYESINPAGLSGALTAAHTPPPDKAACSQLGDGLSHLATHPWELIRWNDIANGHPGRALPAILLLLLPWANDRKK